MVFGFSKSKITKESSTGSSKAAKKAEAPITAIRGMESSMDNASKREAHIQKKMTQTLLDAKKMMDSGDKKGALFAMKRKKMYQGEIEKLQNMQMTLQTQLMHLESAAHNQETYNSMKIGTSAMKKLRKQHGVEDMDDMMDEIREETDIAQEIGQAIGTSMDGMADEDDLMAELEGMVSEDQRQSVPETKATTGVFSMPMLPSRRKKQEAAEMDDLKQLMAA